MCDFECENAKDMYYKELAQGVKHLKEEGEVCGKSTKTF